MMWEERFAELSTVAARQNGMITAAQASRIDVDEAALAHLTDAGLLMELDWAVHQLPWSSLGPRYAFPYAAWLALEPASYAWERVPDAVLSHESACGLHGLGSLTSPLIIFTTIAERAAPKGTKLNLSPLGADDVALVKGVPVTTAQRTIVDLVTDWTDHGALRRVLMDALLRDLVELTEVHRALAPLAARHEFPADGTEFVQYFIPDLTPAQLSPRNRRGYTALMSPDRVADVEPEVARLIEAAGGAPDAQAVRDIAADIVAQTGSPG
ncbi:hypothetical protein ACFOY2_25240 [Nonomuraea purpurea]|uniref:AbiEi antitoxin C-terminal domain-containing protein n=1 Tax=Nonomuraea purpurea TaxID=1849276 RepID=A0ABV8GD01_9ACTN